MKCAIQQAMRWRLVLDNPADGVKVPQQLRNEMQSLSREGREDRLAGRLDVLSGGLNH